MDTLGSGVVRPAGEVYKLNNLGQRVMETFGSGVCPAGNYINLKCQGVMETFGHDYYVLQGNYTN